MKTFKSPGEFAKFLHKVALKEHSFLKHGLEESAKLVQDTAKSEFGIYQDEVGNFPAWAELTDATKLDRVRQGYTENEPLLRSGELRDSITYQIQDFIKLLTALIGSPSDIMVYQELGTVHIPPRPVLGPAGFRNKEKIIAIIAAAALAGLLGADRVEQSFKETMG
jgi:hypothetical protein